MLGTSVTASARPVAPCSARRCPFSAVTAAGVVSSVDKRFSAVISTRVMVSAVPAVWAQTPPPKANEQMASVTRDSAKRLFFMTVS